MRRRLRSASVSAFVLVLLETASALAAGDRAPLDPGPKNPWRGVHIMSPGHEGVPILKKAIAESLAPLGVNVILLEVNYRYNFKSRPELADASGLSTDDARELAALCREHKIELIPLFNCLGHQSWAKRTAALLSKHPEFDETPEVPADNKGIYCRSWCPLHPGVNEVVFTLMDELVQAFDARALHVGMDEVFLVGSEQCPRCNGKDPAELFARAVNDYHKHLVGEKKLTMLMWGDRLLDGKATGYGKWEASENGTFGAIDQIPKDIIICDWHYTKRKSYPSVKLFAEKGFRIWPSSWKDEAAALAFLSEAHQEAGDKLAGHLCTTWASSDLVCRVLLGEGDAAKYPPDTVRLVASIKACMAKMKE